MFLKKGGAGFRRGILITACLLACILCTGILPNLDALVNRIRGYPEVLVGKDAISPVLLRTEEDGRVVCGYYMLCGDMYIRDITVFSRSELTGGEADIYYISEKNQEYGEERRIHTRIEPAGDGWHIRAGVKAYALRIDLGGYRDAEEMLPGRVVFNRKEIRILYANALPFLFLIPVCLLLRRRHRILYDIIAERQLVCSLAGNDLRSRYAGSVIGAVWAYVQPLLTILVMWYVFQVGFRSPPVRHVEFIIWFTAGYVPWMFFQDGLVSITNSIQDYSFLVKKIRFRVSVLPAIRLLASLHVHSFFLGTLLVILLVFRHYPKWIWFQALYYSACLSFLVFSLGLIFSALTVLFRDFGQIAAVLLQVLFWYTPIVWSYEDLAPSVRLVFSVNPVFYVANGFRDTFINHVWFWDNPGRNALFWGITLAIFSLGIVLFDRFRPHFSDLL